MASPEFNSEPLDEATLGLLVQLDEALRSGKDLSESLNGSLSSVNGSMTGELGFSRIVSLGIGSGFSSRGAAADRYVCQS